MYFQGPRCLAARRRERLGQTLREGQALLNRQSGSSAGKNKASFIFYFCSFRVRSFASSVHTLGVVCTGSADSGVGGCSLIISAPQPPPVRPRYCSEPHLSPVERVLLEITETEAVYVRDLEEVVEVNKLMIALHF
jgi:hypothetical protein